MGVIMNKKDKISYYKHLLSKASTELKQGFSELLKDYEDIVVAGDSSALIDYTAWVGHLVLVRDFGHSAWSGPFLLDEYLSEREYPFTAGIKNWTMAALYTGKQPVNMVKFTPESLPYRGDKLVLYKTDSILPAAIMRPARDVPWHHVTEYAVIDTIVVP